MKKWVGGRAVEGDIGYPSWNQKRMPKILNLNYLVLFVTARHNRRVRTVGPFFKAQAVLR
jgi:hypothetical protein